MRAPTVCAFADGASNTSVRPGGYKIRPYGPASGLLVGAACMAARTESRFPPRRGRCGHLPLRGAFADGAPGALGHTHKKPEQAMQRLLRFGTGSGGRTHTVAHRNLNPARLPIPPYPLIQFCSILIWDRDFQVTTGVRRSRLGSSSCPQNKINLFYICDIHAWEFQIKLL